MSRKHQPFPLAWAALAIFGAFGVLPSAHAQDAAATETDTTLSTVTVIGTVDTLQSLDFWSPNSSTVLQRDSIEAQGARKLDQALQYQAGIVSEPFGGDNKVDWFKIRGFDASVALDGTPTTPVGFFVLKPELFGVEAIEVVKGSNSLVFGPTNAGGVVNLVTKRPHKKQALQLNTEVGNRGKRGLGLDYNGIANSDGTAYYRIVAQVRKENGLQHGTEMESYYLAPSATFEFSGRTALTLLVSVQRDEGTPTNGFMPGYGSIIDTPYGKINRRTNLGEPGFDHLKRTQLSAGWLLSHQINDDWAFTQNYKFTRLSLDQQNVYAYSSDGDRLARRGYSYTKGDTNTHYLDNRLTGTLKLGQAKLTSTVGVDYMKSDIDGQNNGFGMAPDLDMFNPVYGTPFTVTSSPLVQRMRQWGAYASAQLQLGQNWNFNAGVRHDNAKNQITGGYNTSHNSFNAGAMYMSSLGIAPYISYSESFRPIGGVDAYNVPYKPYEGQQAEVGVKLEPDWLNGGTMTAAYFDLKEKNALVSDLSNIQRQVGQRTNRGLELQGEFPILRDTTIKVTYTRNNAREDRTTSNTIRASMIPKHQASLWVSQRINLSETGGRLTVAAGARYNGSTVDEVYYPGKKIAAYTLLDLMVRYDINRQWALQVNARNLLDKTYVSSCDAYCYYGNSRTLDMQLQYQWK